MATTPYLDLSAFKGSTLAPASYADEVEIREPGWLLRRLTHWSAWINSRLAKRYAAPFAAAPDTPEAVTGWLEAIVTWELYLKRGIDATDQQLEKIEKRHDTAKAEVAEAADLQTNKFELPLRNDTSTTGVSRGGPLGYGEASPYTWSSRQRDAAGDE
jgi:hypothetical protein